MANVYRPGEIWVNAMGNDVEIVGTDFTEIEVVGKYVEVGMVAYRHARRGASGRVFIRTESSTQAWTKKEA